MDLLTLGINCSIANGGCEHTCVRGPPDQCACNGVGYQLSKTLRDCIDVNECDDTASPVCQGGAICLNTYGSYKCLTLLFGGLSSDTTNDGLALAQQQQETKKEVTGLESGMGNLAAKAGSLQTALLALIGWVVIVTVALATLAFVTYRRWKRNTAYNIDHTGSIDSASTAEGSVLGDSFANSPQLQRGAANEGYDAEDMSPIEVTIERFEPAPVHEQPPSAEVEEAPSSQL